LWRVPATSEAHFSRLFRLTFRLSPSAVRQQAHALPAGAPQPVARAASPAGYEEWLRRLRHRGD
jgi:hypothetical protein